MRVQPGRPDFFFAFDPAPAQPAPLRDGGRLLRALDFDQTDGRPLAVFALDAGGKAERTVHSVEGLERTQPLAALTAERLAALASAPSLQASDRAGAVEAAARLKEAEADGAALARAKADLAEIEADLTRLREHMKALAGEQPAAGAAANPFAARVLAAEDRLTAVRRAIAALETHQAGRREAVATALGKLAR